MRRCMVCSNQIEGVFQSDKENSQSALATAGGSANLLSKREKEVLAWAAIGKTNWESSKILGISERTVNFHLGNVMRKFGVFNKTHAVAKGVALGYVRVALYGVL